MNLPDMPAPIIITVALVKSLFPTGRRVLEGKDILDEGGVDVWWKNIDHQSRLLSDGNGKLSIWILSVDLATLILSRLRAEAPHLE